MQVTKAKLCELMQRLGRLIIYVAVRKLYEELIFPVNFYCTRSPVHDAGGRIYIRSWPKEVNAWIGSARARYFWIRGT